MLLLALPALAAPITNGLHAAGLAAFAVVGFVEVFFRNRVAPLIGEFEVDRCSDVGEAGFAGLFGLEAAFEVVGFSVFDEAAAGSAEDEGDIVGFAFFAECFDPFVVAWAGSAVVFAVATIQ